MKDITMKERIMKLEIQLENHCTQQESDSKDIKGTLLRIEDKLDSKTDNSEFLFWRNLLVGGILISIFLGVVSNWISK
jgi:hypothetical protein